MTTKATERQRLLREFHQLFNVQNSDTNVKVNLQEIKEYVQTHNIDVTALFFHEKMEKWSPLFWACNRSRFDIVKYLIDDCGAKIDGQDAAKQSVLHLAANVGAYKIVEFLLRNDECIKYVNACDIDYESPLHLCAEYGSEKTFDLLLKYGADPSLKNKDNETPLDLLIDSSKTIAQKHNRRKKYFDVLI